MRKLLNIVGLVLWLQVLSFAQCPLVPNRQFKPFSKVEKKGAGHFKWYSAAGDNRNQGGGHPSYVFEREVTNLGQTTLKYMWQVGRMYNNALPAGSTPDQYCQEFGWPNQKDGPLNYGRGNDRADTTVWEGKDEPSKPITSAFKFNILEKDSVVTVTVLVRSSAQPTPNGGFSYHYVLTNGSQKAVNVEWDIKQDQLLVEALRKKDLTYVFDIARAQEISFESPLAPVIGFRGIDILLNNRKVAGVAVPILLPRSK